ncbi:MAG: aminotransferase class III-fold pyridoxal phosphate-dependent enzyme [Lachnospiraceae bacterium]|jgi:acetylornithine/succinyldiaminopimelate/putrescine aminotransferase|nr:aminotransferase class III-fold pyridoxal phosphate-dependent enzyme [Lachnospiraceae bacterium]
MLHNMTRSLSDLLGRDYMEAVKNAAVETLGMDRERAKRLADEGVDFYPSEFAGRCDDLAVKVGEALIAPMKSELEGAPTESFRRATNVHAAPVGGLGCVRIGQDGRIYLAAKSEHYHIPLGHHFPGYELITRARKLGIPNATHNNTRGYITRRMERQIVMDIHGIREPGEELEEILASKEPKVLNRLINLETGSLAVEAAMKMLLTRFYRLDKTFGEPKYQGKTPVFLVVEDNEGGLEANYHGTTVLAQMLRGMWPELRERMEKAGICRIVSVKRNDIGDFEAKIKEYNEGVYRTAGFLHEIILMNYGGIRLLPEYLQRAYELCAQYDTPTVADEIQSCMWYKGMFLFKEYRLKPDFVIIGKGFPGGEYPASKVITTYEMDSLNQFGALVTNGQEELASLAYLITMEFVRGNGEEIARMGQRTEEILSGLAAKFPGKLTRVEGQGHLAALHFSDVEEAGSFAKTVNHMCIDVSTQLYKADCPPAVLLKLPLVVSERILGVLEEKFSAALEAL